MPDITRPNGKLYRPRQPPSVSLFQDRDDCTGVAVLRTHDLTIAHALAHEALREYDLDPFTAERGWWRLVPWDATGIGCDSTWIPDPVRGIPVVIWEYL